MELRNGTVLRGRVIDLGGNAIEMQLRPGANRRVPLREVRKAEFEASEEPLATDADVVFRKNGAEVRGAAEYAEDGKRVVVTRPDGSRVEIPREDVARILYKDDARPETAGIYSKRVRDEVARSIQELKVGRENAAPAEERLRAHGIFALRAVEEARRGVKAGSPEAKALDRVLKLYRLREATPDALQDLSDYYRILSQGTVEEKRGLLEEMFTRYVEDSVPVAKFLIRDRDEEPAVRAWAVDLLGRMQLNRDLVEVFNDPAGGQVQLAAAIALARNRILAGAESLIQALEMDEPGVREIAVRALKDAVGNDFGFHAHDTPSLRKAAIAKWRKWWVENRAAVETQAANLLSGLLQPEDTPERRKALDLWKQGCLAWERRRFSEAESALRGAVRADPLFVNAQVSLGVLLYLHRQKGEEGRRLLEDLLSRRLAELRPSDTAWIHFYMGEAWEVAGDLEKAELAYGRALAVDPQFFRAAGALGDLKFRSATRGEALDADARRKLLTEAHDRYRAAIELVDAYNVELETLVLSDLPVDTTPAFERQEHNRSVLEVKVRLRKRKAEMLFGLAKVRSLLGEPGRAVAEAASAIEVIADDRDGGARELLIELHNYRGFLLEEAGEPAEALAQYRRVVREDLDPKNGIALEGIRRLRAKTGRAEEGVRRDPKAKKGKDPNLSARRPRDE